MPLWNRIRARHDTESPSDSSPVIIPGVPRSYVQILARSRDFRLLYFAALVSLAGDWFLTVALLDLVLELTGSATLASLIVVCQTLPIFLTTPLAGHLIDKLDRKKLM